jgi:uncharacterized protein (TIGR03435 family)
MGRGVLFISLIFAEPSVHAQAAKKLEFEVASIKPTPPPDGKPRVVGCRGGPGSKDPELFSCGNMSLANLVTYAYRLNYYQLSAPEWMKDPFAAFDIAARVPEGATKDDFYAMLQNLLADRFKLMVHHESREMQQYDLAVAKSGSKFKEAAPQAPKPDGDDDGKPPAFPPPKMGTDGYPVLGGGGGMAMMGGRARMYGPEMTMAMLAGQISGQLGKPVTDATGLSGKYEVSLYWDAVATKWAGSPPAAGGPETPVARDPGPTLIEALQDQLGLRLESKKGPVDFLVVDHAEKVPTEN